MHWPERHWKGRVVLFAAHPDDEVIGAGGQFTRISDLWIVHATDGAPANMTDAHNYGFATREEYAQARRNELLAAMKVAALDPVRAQQLGFVDQETMDHLPDLIREVLRCIRELNPDTILAPSYEGGHPDHDSLAFAVHQARARLETQTGSLPELIEYALYHNRDGRMATCAFPSTNGVQGEVEILNPGACALKRRMLDCFATQREVLAQFPADRECFRPAPKYDFLRPPHSGRLYYEYFDWRSTGEQWRAHALDAMVRITDGQCLMC